jgi:hypothetical protein
MGVGPGIGLWGPGTGLWMVSSPGRYKTARTAKIALTGLKRALYSIVAQMQHPEGKWRQCAKSSRRHSAPGIKMSSS